MPTAWCVRLDARYTWSNGTHVFDHPRTMQIGKWCMPLAISQICKPYKEVAFPRVRKQQRQTYMNGVSHLKSLCWTCLFLLLLIPAGSAAEVSVNVAVEKEEVFVGESFIFQIQVAGADDAEEPDLSAIKGFDSESLGGQKNNSESISFINGRMSRVVHRGYVLSYRLTPQKTGIFTIPSLGIVAGGQTFRTQTLQVRVKEPQETRDFKLRMSLSQEKCYQYEPVELTVIWYINKDVRRFGFTLPVLDDQRFGLDDPETPAASSDLFTLPVGKSEVIAQKSRGFLDGKTYTTVTFKKILIPRLSGKFDIERAVVSCEALVGKQQRGDDFFSDDFFNFSTPVYKKFVVPSNGLSLEVKELPEQGKPSNFAGHVGRYKIDCTASPLEVNVGDPITLHVAISGTPYLKNVELPSLQDQPAFHAFKIPKEIAAGKVQDNKKIFTQTLRAQDASVKEIPAIELPYFDTQSGQYALARSEPIPLKIHPTKVVTAQDAEGRRERVLKTELEIWAEGIAHNYEDSSVLQHEQYGIEALLQNRLWRGAVLLPLACYLILLTTTLYVRRRNLNPEARRARKAYGKLRAELTKVSGGKQDYLQICSGVLEALRVYLGSKLRIPSASMTYRDAEEALQKYRITPSLLEKLQKIFTTCEAGRYAGNVGGTAESLPEETDALAKELEKWIK